MKKIETGKLIKDYHGVVLKNGDEEMTVGSVLSNILSFTKSEDQAKSFVLGKKFALEKEVELTAADIVFIRPIIKASTFFPLIAGQLLMEIGE